MTYKNHNHSKFRCDYAARYEGSTERYWLAGESRKCKNIRTNSKMNVIFIIISFVSEFSSDHPDEYRSIYSYSTDLSNTSDYL